MEVLDRGAAFVIYVGIIGCASPSTPEERWRETGSYYALLELVDEHLERAPEGTLTRSRVREILGAPGQYPGSPESGTWCYAGSRRVPWGHYLLIRFDPDGTVGGFEWVSE